MELRATRETKRNEKLDKALAKKEDAPAKAQTQSLPKKPAADQLSLSRQALNYLERQSQLRQELEERQARQNSLIEGHLNAMETKKRQLDTMDKTLKMMRKCDKIAAAIMRGDRVPPEDLRYLMNHDQNGYKLAMAMRRPKKDPERVESVLDEEDRRGGSGESVSDSRPPTTLGGESAAWSQAQGASLVLSALGQGTAATEVLDTLGLEATEKTVLLLAAPRSARLVRRAARELWLDVPGRGILMTVPISSIGGARARDYLLQWQAEEDDMDKEITHELIVVITNRGHTDQVMDAARSAGAAGGTTIHAKGTGTELARKFFGVSLAAEKEIVFILAREADRKPIMKAVMTQAGMATRAQSVVFSMPVTDIAGLRLLEEDGDA